MRSQNTTALAGSSAGTPGARIPKGMPEPGGHKALGPRGGKKGVLDFCSSKPSRNGAATDNGAGAAGTVREQGQGPRKAEQRRILVLSGEKG